MIGAVAAVAGRPVTISGYAQDFSGAVARVCFSGDGGSTWTALMRAERADSSATPEPARVRVVAQASNAQELLERAGFSNRQSSRQSVLSAAKCKSNCSLPVYLRL